MTDGLRSPPIQCEAYSAYMEQALNVRIAGTFYSILLKAPPQQARVANEKIEVHRCIVLEDDSSA